MATHYTSITAEQAALIRNAPLFFVATADPSLENGPDGTGAVNLSPKGGTPLHILTPNRVAYLDYPGSGNETARHAISGGPITIMVCSFEDGDAGIVRLYGHARIVELDDSPLARKMLETPAQELNKPRQVIEVNIEKNANELRLRCTRHGSGQRAPCSRPRSQIQRPKIAFKEGKELYERI